MSHNPGSREELLFDFMFALKHRVLPGILRAITHTKAELLEQALTRELARGDRLEAPSAKPWWRRLLD